MTSRLLRRLRSLPWRWYVFALWWLPQVDLRLRLRGYAPTRRWLQQCFSPSTAPALGEMQVLAMARGVSLAAHYTFWPTSCLRQAMLLHALLTRGGEASELKIGVALDADRGFGAHAWVRWRGRVLIGGEAASRRYASLL